MTTVLENPKLLQRKLEVRLAEDQYELEQALSLRYQVFNLELGEGLSESHATHKDRDQYDYFCDHLIVLDKSNDSKVVGTYRLLRRQPAKENIGFYSETEFKISNLYTLEDEIAEVGRSCVHPDYRDGAVISLLWSGIADYIKKYDIRYLTGCASIHSTDPKLVSEIYSYLKQNNFIENNVLEVKPLDTHILEGFNPDAEFSNDIKKKIPTMIKGYMRLGAKYCGTPALDIEFGTVDLLVLFDSKVITEKYGKKYELIT